MARLPVALRHRGFDLFWRGVNEVPSEKAVRAAFELRCVCFDDDGDDHEDEVHRVLSKCFRSNSVFSAEGHGLVMERNMIPLMVEIDRLPSVCFSKALEFVQEHVDILRGGRSLYGLFLVLCGTYLQISGYVWDQATNRVEVEPFTDMVSLQIAPAIDMMGFGDESRVLKVARLLQGLDEFLDHYDYSKETRSFSVPYPLWGMENVEEESSAPAEGPFVFNFTNKDGVAKVASFHPVGYGLERPPREDGVGDEFVCGYRMQIEFAFKR